MDTPIDENVELQPESISAPAPLSEEVVAEESPAEVVAEETLES